MMDSSAVSPSMIFFTNDAWRGIWGVERELRAHVEVLDSFSAHADRNDLIAYARACGTDTRRMFLVHGEAGSQESLRAALTARNFRVAIPERGETVELL
jgi:metallo-beta-lactamase family protein